MDVQKVADLARMELTTEEKKQYQSQLKSILKYFEELSQIDTEQIEPLVTPTDIELVYREDKAETILSVEEALMNAPERAGNLFKVPPVV